MALVNSAGTLFAKAPGGTVLVAQAEIEPKVQVLVNVYEDTPYDKVNFPTQKKALKFRAGQIVKQSEWDAAFLVPTITTVFPAAGLAAGGLPVTVTGTGFTTATAVTFGGTAATSIVVKNATTLTCVNPAKTAGSYNVVATTAGGAATKTNGFVYS